MRWHYHSFDCALFTNNTCSSSDLLPTITMDTYKGMTDPGRQLIYSVISWPLPQVCLCNTGCSCNSWGFQRMKSAQNVVQLGQEGIRLFSVGSKGPHLLICCTSILYGKMKGVYNQVH